VNTVLQCTVMTSLQQRYVLLSTQDVNKRNAAAAVCSEFT